MPAIVSRSLSKNGAPVSNAETFHPSEAVKNHIKVNYIDTGKLVVETVAKGALVADQPYQEITVKNTFRNLAEFNEYINDPVIVAFHADFDAHCLQNGITVTQTYQGEPGDPPAP